MNHMNNEMENNTALLEEQECQENVKKENLNPWLMTNILMMQFQTLNTPTGWLEWDYD